MKWGHLIIAILAMLIFAWVMAHMNLGSMVQQLKAMLIAVPIILTLSAIRLYFQSVTWSASLKVKHLSIEGGKLAAVRLASQSMGYLTVFGPVISEPMKIKLLGTPAEPTITATFLDDGVYWFTSTLIAICGLLSLLLLSAHGVRYHSIPAILGLGLVLFVITRRNSMLSYVVRAFGNRAPCWLIRAEKAEVSIRTFRFEHPALVNKIFWFDIASQLLTASEVFAVLWALHLPIHFVAALAIEGVTRTLKLMSGWIPARLGSDEGGAISAFAIVGLSPMLGLSLALTRRTRDLLWALIGIAWLAWNSRTEGDHSGRAASVPTLMKEVL